jgi:hypothetical protein
MIYPAMKHIAFELNQSLRRPSFPCEDIVVLGSPVDTAGKADQATADKVLLFLAGIECDTLRSAPAFLNLYLMVAANFSGSRYADALDYISRVIAFFQVNQVFDRNSSPAMDENIEKLILDIEIMDRRELNNIWGMFGGKYMPSVIYRMRMIGIDADAIRVRRVDMTVPDVWAGVKGE